MVSMNMFSLFGARPENTTTTSTVRRTQGQVTVKQCPPECLNYRLLGGEASEAAAWGFGRVHPRQRVDPRKIGRPENLTLGAITPRMPAMTAAARFRVEELARRSGLSVDTIRFYQKRGLLDHPEREGRIVWYGPAHAERLERIRELQAEGLTLAVIGKILRGELDNTDLLLAAVVLRAQLDQGEVHLTLMTLAELAERSGVPVELIETVVREGLLVPRWVDGVQYFTDVDIRIVEAGLALLGTGIPLPELMELARQHDRASRQTAEDAVALFDAHIRQPLRRAVLSPDDRAGQLVEAFNKLLPAATALVAHHFRRVLLEIAQSHLESVGEPAEIAAAMVEARKLREPV